ncbi:MAG TPA: endonuclease/exonuclease/phosphatase family protein [Phycisphaerae bacterium]|nr:endonuclease/exonuclease/phosphatase family protein [Phycisphaerae bacterium]
MRASRGLNRILTGGLVLALLAPAAAAVQVRILSWNILTYNDPGTAEFEALKRIVQALDPDIILFQEANNSTGRSRFLTDFRTRYPYNYLGPPFYENPRNQVVSAFPIKSAGIIWCKVGTTQTNFERPTIWAELDIDSPPDGAADVRVFSTHYKSGSTTTDGQTRLNQATEDDAVITGLLTSDPNYQIYYAGDLNCQLGDAPLNRIQSHLTRLSIIDPNNGSPVTYPSSGRIIDHILYSVALQGRITNQRIFNSATGTPPPPALSGDSATASDHLSLISTVDLLTTVTRYPPSITAAASRKTHTTAGTFDIDVFAAHPTEPRKDGPTQVVVTFDRPIRQFSNTNDDVQVTSGTVGNLAINGNQLTITLSGATNASPLYVGFAGITTAGNPALGCSDVLCIRVLRGDVTTTTGSETSTVNSFDLIATRAQLGRPVTSSNFRSDNDASGTVNSFDLINVRAQLGRSVTGCQ